MVSFLVRRIILWVVSTVVLLALMLAYHTSAPPF